MKKRSPSKKRRSNKRPQRLRFVAAARPVFQWSLALLLLPFLGAALRQLWQMLPSMAAEGVGSWWLYPAGAAGYWVMERFVRKPSWLYVFGHETTHALTGLLSGARVYSFKAGENGGEVRLSKSNGFIAISPYIVPIYALGLIVMFAALRSWWPRPALTPVFQFLLGAALAFHVSSTASAVHLRQPDLRVLGFLLSFVLILVGNSLIFGVLAVSLFRRTPTFTEYSRAVGSDTLHFWRSIASMTQQEIKRLNDSARPGDTWTR